MTQSVGTDGDPRSVVTSDGSRVRRVPPRRRWWDRFRSTPGGPPPVPGAPSRPERRHLVRAARRDAEATLPLMSTPSPAPTATVQAIVAERDQAVSRELWLATRDAEHALSGLGALRVLIAAATLAIDDAAGRAAAEPGEEPGAVQRRLGEDGLDDVTVARRRQAEARRRDDGARAELARCTAVRDRLLVRAADLQAHLDQRVALARARANEWHGHHAERCSIYVEELTRHHVDGPTLLHLGWPALPPLPVWTSDHRTALALVAPDHRGGGQHVDDTRPGSTSAT